MISVDSKDTLVALLKFKQKACSCSWTGSNRIIVLVYSGMIAVEK